VALSININGTLELDQSSGLQDTGITTDDGNDIAYLSLSSGFRTFLSGLNITSDESNFASAVGAVNTAVNPGGGTAYVTVTGATAPVTKLFFSASDGSQLSGQQAFWDADNNSATPDVALQTVTGQNIYFWSYNGGSYVVATTSNVAGQGDVVAAFYLNPSSDNTSASIEYVTFIPLLNPDTTNPDDNVNFGKILNVSALSSLDFSLDNLPSGNFLFVDIGTSSASLLVSGLNPQLKADGSLSTHGDSVNSSQGGTGATIGINDQHFDPGNTGVFSLVKGETGQNANGDLTATNISQLNYTDFINVSSAAVFISQVQGNPGTNYTLTLDAWTAGLGGKDSVTAVQQRSYLDNNLTTAPNDGTEGTSESALRDDSRSTIYHVVVLDNNGMPVADATRGGASSSYVTFNSNGSVTVQHLNSQYTVQWYTDNPNTSDTVETFNRFWVTSNVGKLDIGKVSVIQSSTATTPVGQDLQAGDDAPTISFSGTPTNLQVDESALASGGLTHTLTTHAEENFATLFTKSFGTDGAATSNSTTYTLTGNTSGSTGLTDTLSGQVVVLVQTNATTVTATAGPGGATVFTVSVNSTGLVSFDLSRSVVHSTSSTNGDSDESASTLASGLITLTAKVTDGDGDSNSAPADIGSLLRIHDDGPTISFTGTPTNLQVDESALASGALSHTLTSHAEENFATLFTNAFGADGAATSNSTAYTLTGNTSGSTGLTDTLSGLAVVLVQTNATTVTATAGAGGATVFTVSVDLTGLVSFDLSRSVKQSSADSNGDSDESASTLASGLITLTAKVTDGDGDSKSAPADIGSLLRIHDDGPTITVNDTSVNSSSTAATYSTGAHGTWSDNAGSDGFGSLGLSFDQFQIDSHGYVNTTATNSTFTKGADDFHYTGSITADFNGDAVNDTVTFSLALNNNNGSYDLTVNTPPATAILFDTSQGSLAAGGPDAVQTLGIPGHGNVVFFGAVATAPHTGGGGASPNDINDLVTPSPDLTEQALEALNATNLINASTKMNVSTSGIGINNNNLDGATSGLQAGDESFVVNPTVNVDSMRVFIDNSVGGYTPATEQLVYTVYYTDGTVGTDHLVGSTDLHAALRSDPTVPSAARGGTYFDIDGGTKQIDAVQLTMQNGTIKVPVIQFAVEQAFNPQSLDLKFTAGLSDGDSDTSHDPFAIHLQPDLIV
jgi:Domain of unknown function (DUF5801)